MYENPNQENRVVDAQYFDIVARERDRLQVENDSLRRSIGHAYAEADRVRGMLDREIGRDTPEARAVTPEADTRWTAYAAGNRIGRTAAAGKPLDPRKAEMRSCSTPRQAVPGWVERAFESHAATDSAAEAEARETESLAHKVDALWRALPQIEKRFSGVQSRIDKAKAHTDERIVGLRKELVGDRVERNQFQNIVQPALDRLIEMIRPLAQGVDDVRELNRQTNERIERELSGIVAEWRSINDRLEAVERRTTQLVAATIGEGGDWPIVPLQTQLRRLDPNKPDVAQRARERDRIPHEPGGHYADVPVRGELRGAGELGAIPQRYVGPTGDVAQPPSNAQALPRIPGVHTDS